MIGLSKHQGQERESQKQLDIRVTLMERPAPRAYCQHHAPVDDAVILLSWLGLGRGDDLTI